MQTRLFVALALALGLAACGRSETATDAAAPPPAAAQPEPGSEAAPAADAGTGAPAPYTYPAPVAGRIDDVNTGHFDLVDGIAYPDDEGKGTVLMALSKSLATPLLTDPRCLRERVQALGTLRDAGFADVTVDEKGVSPYFGRGMFVGGSARDGSPPESKYWRIAFERNGDRAKGEVKHRNHGGFTYDLAIRGKPLPPDSYEPGVEPMLAVYQRIRTAVLAGDLAGALAAQGFTPEQVAAVRGLPGIDADFAAFKERFVEPGTPEPDDVREGDFYVGGKTPGGKSMWMRYAFVQCGDSIVLNEITESEL